jgi:hypothetical protein
MSSPCRYVRYTTVKITRQVMKGDGGRSAKSIRSPLRVPFGAKAVALGVSQTKLEPISGPKTSAKRAQFKAVSPLQALKIRIAIQISVVRVATPP